MGNRRAVTLRFNPKDIPILTNIIKKEFGPEVRLEKGLTQIIINTAQAYINNLAEAIKQKKEEENGRDTTSNGVTGGSGEGNDDSNLLANKETDVDK